MIGICYYKNGDDYLLNKQLENIISDTEDSLLIEQSASFSGPTADEMIQEAIDRKCNKLVFLTEEKNVNMLSELIPQEYGEYFENIQILAENFVRYNENDTVATQTQTAPVQQKQQQPQQIKDKVVFIYDGAVPNTQGANDFNNLVKSTKTTFANLGIPQDADIKYWFSNVESAGLTASGVKTLYQKFPEGRFSEFLKQFSEDSWDGSILQVIQKAGESETCKANKKYYFFVSKKLFQQVGSYKDPNGLIVINQLNYDTFENKNNSKILNYIMELAKDEKDNFANVEKRTDIQTNSKEFAKQMNLAKEKIEYISSYINCFNWWTTHKNEVRMSKESEKELMKAIADSLVKGFELDTLKQQFDDAGGKFITDTIGKISKAVKDDLKKKTPENTRDEKETGNRMINIFTYKHYEELCEMLFDK